MTEIDTPPNPLPLIETEAINSFKGPEFRLSQAHLYHGSGRADINELQVGRDDDSMPATLADGLFFTIDKESAAAYARHRAASGRGANPTVYVARTTDGLRIANLNNAEQKHTLFNGFQQYLYDLQPKTNIESIVRTASIDNLERTKERLGTKALTLALQGGTSYLFANFMKEQGYDGLTAAEGGEGHGEYAVMPHLSVVIFDPETVTIVERTSAKTDK